MNCTVCCLANGVFKHAHWSREDFSCFWVDRYLLNHTRKQDKENASSRWKVVLWLQCGGLVGVIASNLVLACGEHSS